MTSNRAMFIYCELNHKKTHMKNLFRISLLALAIVFTSCSDDDDNQTLPAETNTIVDIEQEIQILAP